MEDWLVEPFLFHFLFDFQVHWMPVANSVSKVQNSHSFLRYHLVLHGVREQHSWHLHGHWLSVDCGIVVAEDEMVEQLLMAVVDALAEIGSGTKEAGIAGVTKDHRAGDLNWRHWSEVMLMMDAVLQSVMPVSDDLAVGMVQRKHPYSLQDLGGVHYHHHGFRNQHSHFQREWVHYWEQDNHEELLLLRVLGSDSSGEENKGEKVAVVSMIAVSDSWVVDLVDKQHLL